MNSSIVNLTKSNSSQQLYSSYLTLPGMYDYIIEDTNNYMLNASSEVLLIISRTFNDTYLPLNISIYFDNVLYQVVFLMNVSRCAMFTENFATASLEQRGKGGKFFNSYKI